MWNPNSGYGQATFSMVHGARNTFGKTLVVCPANDPNYNKLSQLFQNDPLAQPMFFPTIQLAHDEGALSGRGDVIMIAPGTYAENVSITKDFVQLVGIEMPGYARPDVISPAGGGFAINVHAQGFTASHIRFAGSGVGGIGAQQQGNGFIYEDCVFESSSNIGLRLLPDNTDDSFTASEGHIYDCLIRDCAGGGISFENPGPLAGVGVTDVVIKGCVFYGNTGADIFDVYTAGGNNKTFTVSVITNCQFADKNKAVYIDLSAGTLNSGMISDNFFAFTTAGGLTVTQIVLGNDIVFSGNYDSIGVVDGHTF